MTKLSQNHYSGFAKWLHWCVAALILVQYLLIELAERAEHSSQVVKQLGLIANHKSIGITILLIAIIRLAFRFGSKPLLLPPEMPKWQITASHLSHVLLYAFLFALPISGWLMSSANAYSVSWFNVFSVPDLVSADKATAEWLKLIHTRLADALIILAALHILAAAKHHLIDQDTILVRMVSKSSVVGSVLIGLISLIMFGGLLPGRESPTNESNLTAEIDPDRALNSTTIATQSITESTLPVWQIDYDNSHIKFTAEQAGATFTGEWQQWSGKLQFSSTELEQARFDVNIDINSVSSADIERDDTIRSLEFFNAAEFPQAQFRAQDFKANTYETGELKENENSYTANGILTMKGLSHPVVLSFNVKQQGKNITLIGQSKLVRHAWNIGTGDWADPTWVGSDVEVNVKVVATLP